MRNNSLKGMIFSAIATAFIVATPTAAFAYDAKDFHPYSKPSELLAEVITLKDCPGLKIKEWRASKFSVETTSPSSKAIDILNDLCKLANEKYPEFIEAKYGEKVSFSIDTEMFMMPAYSDRDGKSFRNLNDSKFRFSQLFTDCCFWGFYAYRMNLLFMRNDVLALDKDTHELRAHSGFARTFLHEYAHVQNKQSGIRTRRLDDSEPQDEALVSEYLKFIGIKPGSESPETAYSEMTGQRKYSYLDF